MPKKIEGNFCKQRFRLKGERKPNMPLRFEKKALTVKNIEGTPIFHKAYEYL